ncbi:cytochrome c oxidase accessory protein CcoG [Undibacter mobilis]|uniref:Cytochrome c oxidase accessory protein CcoG n=1 Tax=Undibacter mobilis TaxID=2292256 RepID=A0A371B9Y0_9BRAD|nr:cytochrome c oxidase accessory protein CcoG [Undibacter mobilis]RDV04364.1 cytochrome c oxidase accessory protein CcoG [Undibacter mobilis]
MTQLEELVRQSEVKAAPPPAPPGGDDIDEIPLYAARRKIYPQSVQGTFRRIKWIVLLVTLGIYYILPFVRWDRGPNAPSQAVLIDFPNRRFYFFFIELWPQEVYYLTGLLILAAIGLFLMNALAGRVWCGYLCPQTVWTDLYMAIERFTEGDRREHMKRESQPWTVETYARKGAKHFLWLMVAWWTGGAWVLYFADAPTLVKDLATGNAPFVAYAWIGILTVTTYTLAGHMREQVCLYMCPWPRIQAALTDEYALNVTYRYDRGEPRMSAKKAEQLKAQGERVGDCVDCLQCVHVCPTGIDIRQGSQLGCIQCGLCIDACNTIMAKLGRPRNLIAYDTDLNIKERLEGRPSTYKPIRWRTALYAAIIAVAGGIMIYTLATRGSEGISVIHDRNPMFVRLSDGSLRNGYTIRIVNKQLKSRDFVIAVDGLPSTLIDFVGLPPRADGRQLVAVGPDQTKEVRILVTDYSNTPPAASTSVLFSLIDVNSGEVAQVRDHFFGPEGK